MADANATLAPQKAIDSPRASAPDLLSTLELAGPLESKTDTLELRGGDQTLGNGGHNEHCARRGAQGEFGALFITTAPPDDGVAGLPGPPSEGYIRRWSPQVIGGRPLFAS